MITYGIPPMRAALARFLPFTPYPMITRCPDFSTFCSVATHWHRPGSTFWMNRLEQTNEAKGWPREMRKGVAVMVTRAITRKTW